MPAVEAGCSQRFSLWLGLRKRLNHARDKTAAVVRAYFAHQVRLRRFPELIALMVKDKKSWTGSRRQFSKLSRRCVILEAHPLPFWRRFRVTSFCVDFMD